MADDDYGTLAARMGACIGWSGVSAREIDRLAGGSLGWASKVVGGTDPGAGRLAAYAEVLGVSLDWLVRGEGSAPQPWRVRRAVEDASARSVA